MWGSPVCGAARLPQPVQRKDTPQKYVCDLHYPYPRKKYLLSKRNLRGRRPGTATAFWPPPETVNSSICSCAINATLMSGCIGGGGGTLWTNAAHAAHPHAIPARRRIAAPIQARVFRGYHQLGLELTSTHYPRGCALGGCIPPDPRREFVRLSLPRPRGLRSPVLAICGGWLPRGGDTYLRRRPSCRLTSPSALYTPRNYWLC